MGFRPEAAGKPNGGIAKMRVILLVVSVLLSVQGKDAPDERLKKVARVFVTGNNSAAIGARQILSSGKTCLSLASRKDDAEAVLDVGADAQSMGGAIGGLGGRTWFITGSLTLSSGGDLVWSRSERSTDAPLIDGAKSGGSLLVRHLADAACKGRARAPKVEK
jgi:hypothetical protein